MSSSELQKQGTNAKIGCGLSIVGIPVCIYLFSGLLMWLTIVGCVVLAGYFFKKIMKNYAETGRRF